MLEPCRLGGGRVQLLVPSGMQKIENRCFEDLTSVLVHGLTELGIEVSVDAEYREGRGLVLAVAPHELPPGTLEVIPANSIVYNWEPLGREPAPWIADDWLPQMMRFTVWDYSFMNARKWRAEGARRLQVVPLGYAPTLALDYRPRHAEVDVAFYGFVNERRERVLNQMASMGISTRRIYGKYGNELLQELAGARMVINIHGYSPGTLEMTRLAPLWASGIPVISEKNADSDFAVPPPGGAITAPYELLAVAAREALRSQDLSDRAEHVRRQIMKWPAMSSLLRGAFSNMGIWPTERFRPVAPHSTPALQRS